MSCPLGPSVAHPPHRFTQKWAAPRAVLAALAQPAHHVSGSGGDSQQRVIAPLAGIAVMTCPFLGPDRRSADGGVQVDGQRRVAGSRPGRPGACQHSRLTRSSWRTWPQRKLRRKVPRVDGALTMQPETLTVPPARSASASSMQVAASQGREVTSVIILSPVFARPARRRVKVMVDEFPQAQVLGEGHPGSSSPALATSGGRQTRFGWHRDGCVVASIGCSLFPGVFCLKTIIPDSQEHPLASSRAVPKAVPRWIRAKFHSDRLQ